MVFESINSIFVRSSQCFPRAQFARRDSVYYNPNSVRIQDAFLITCTINSTPSPPVPPLKVPYQTVPRDLLDVVGALMDDPVYSDVEFVLPKSRCANEDVKGKQTIRRGRRIFAARKILMRAEYFAASELNSNYLNCQTLIACAVFNSGFSEATLGNYVFLAGTSQMETDIDPTDKRGNSDSDVDVSREFDDSDIEDEEMIPDTSYESDEAHNKPAQQIARDDDQDIDVVASKPSEESKDDAGASASNLFASTIRLYFDCPTTLNLCQIQERTRILRAWMYSRKLNVAFVRKYRAHLRLSGRASAWRGECHTLESPPQLARVPHMDQASVLWGREKRVLLSRMSHMPRTVQSYITCVSFCTMMIY